MRKKSKSVPRRKSLNKSKRIPRRKSLNKSKRITKLSKKRSRKNSTFSFKGEEKFYNALNNIRDACKNRNEHLQKDGWNSFHYSMEKKIKRKISEDKRLKMTSKDIENVILKLWKKEKLKYPPIQDKTCEKMIKEMENFIKIEKLKLNDLQESKRIYRSPNISDDYFLK